MAVIETWFNQDLQEAVKVHYLDGNMFTNNGNGNRVGVIVTNNGEEITLSGAVSGYVITPDGSTVPCTGSMSGNRASILIPAAAYQPGNIFISIFLTDDTTVTTLAAISTGVLLTRTNAQVDPGSVVTDWTQTINAAMQAVETAAEGLVGVIAVPYASLTFPVPLGKYTYYDGKLYRCITPIATSEAFTPAHWQQRTMGDDVSNIKSELSTKASIQSILPDPVSTSGGNIYYTANPDGSVSVRSSAAASRNVYMTYVSQNDALPAYIVPGGFIYVYLDDRFSSTNVLFEIYWFDSESNFKRIYVNTPGVNKVYIPDDIAHVAIRLTVLSGNTASGTIRPVVLNSVGSFFGEEQILTKAEKYLEGIIESQYPEQFATTNISLTYESQSGYIDQYGILQTYSGMLGAFVDVEPFETYILTSPSYYGMARAAFYDIAGNIIPGQVVWSSNDYAENVNTVFVIPQYAKRMILQKYETQSNAVLKKANSIIPQKSAVHSVLYGKNVTTIGDSITEHNYKAKTNWCMWMTEWAGAVVQNLGIGGTGFAKSQPYINRISQIQESPDIIGVAVSWNDMSAGVPVGTASDTGTSTLAGYANDFFSALISAYPTTPIICYCQGPWGTVRPGVTKSDSWMEVIKQICNLKGIPFYGDLYFGSVLRPWNSDNQEVYYKSDNPDPYHPVAIDDVHPNSEGHKVIARYLYPKFAQNIVAVGADYQLGFDS